MARVSGKSGKHNQPCRHIRVRWRRGPDGALRCSRCGFVLLRKDKAA